MKQLELKNNHFKNILQGFIQWLQRINYAEETIKGRQNQVHYFLRWIEEKGIIKLDEITPDILQQYNYHLHQRPIKSKTIEGYVSLLKLLNEYLKNYGETPIKLIELSIDKDIKIERTILSETEITTLYKNCDTTAWGMRDRAIIALFYGCGLRCKEGTALELGDVDFTSSLVHVRKGKNYKERYVPMSPGVKAELKQWLENGHEIFSTTSNYILPNRYGNQSHSSGLNQRLKRLCEKSKIDKQITLHCLRHSIATHLLASGMSIDQISMFLGHQGLEATQIYTRVQAE
jgi:integrase/recombinase XerD